MTGIRYINGPENFQGFVLFFIFVFVLFCLFVCLFVCLLFSNCYNNRKRVSEWRQLGVNVLFNEFRACFEVCPLFSYAYVKQLSQS